MKVRFRLISPCLLIAALAACQTEPGIGSHVRVEIVQVPKSLGAIHQNPAIPAGLDGLALDIRAGRLVRAGCSYADSRQASGVGQWYKLVLLPPELSFRPNAIARIRPHDDPSLRGLVWRVEAYQHGVAEADYLRYRHSFAKSDTRAFRCQWASDGEPQAVELNEPVHGWEYDYARAERLRHGKLTAEELESGRVALGSCSLKLATGERYYQPLWLITAQPGTQFAMGEVVEIEAGEAESGGGEGRLSRLIRKLGVRADFPQSGAGHIDCY